MGPAAGWLSLRRSAAIPGTDALEGRSWTLAKSMLTTYLRGRSGFVDCCLVGASLIENMPSQDFPFEAWLSRFLASDELPGTMSTLYRLGLPRHH